MPTTKRCLTESDANHVIGGVPTMHYFDYQSRGRGQVVRLFWEDAGIAYDDIRYSFEEYPEYKNSRIAGMNPLGTIPVIELNGRILTQSYAILRHFARQLGKYEGKTEDEIYWTDAMCDIGIDWRTLFVNAMFSPNQKEIYAEHCKKVRPRFLQGMETHLTTHHLSKTGPYILGENVTYADFVIYQIMHDENLTKDGSVGLKDYPRLTKLFDAVESRPNIKAFLQSDRYHG